MSRINFGSSATIGLATERAGLHRRNETHLDLEIFPSGVNLGPGRDLVSRRSGVITECLLGLSHPVLRTKPNA